MDKRAQQALRQTRNSDIQYRIGLVLYRYSRYSKYIHSNKQSTTKFTRELIPSIIKFIDELCGKAVHRRRVGRWYLCETLGKGGYSWVKKGIDEKTGKQVALKFISRKHASWTETQINQIHTEISILRNIRHPNIMKLLAYNLKCQYPNESGTGSDEVILLVLEYMNGGELFDYLYYTGRFNEIVARTYFNQLCHAVITCHEYGIIHRDIKPQNLLLNYRFQLKLTDFGLSKMLKQESIDKTMKTHVGTAGYQAPEIVEGKRYTKQVDTFSIGVVLFIFIAGHPPFNNATKNDKWYSHIYKGDYNSFWKTHTKTKKYFTKNKILLDLVTRMLLKNPDKRINLKDVYRHKWMKKQPVLDSTNLQKYFKLRFREMRRLRQNDPIKQEMLKGDCYYDPSKKLTNRGVFEENKLMPLGYKLDTKPHTLYENIIKDKIVNDVSIITSDIVPKKGTNDNNNNDDSKDSSNNNDNNNVVTNNNDDTTDNISFDDITFEDVGDGDGDVFTLGVYDIYLKDKYNNLAWDVLECIEHTIVEVFSGRIISNNYQMFELIVEITIETNGLSQSIPITISFRLFNSQEKKCLFLQIKNITNVDETKLTHELINQAFHLIMKNKYLASYLFVSLKDVNKTDKTLTDEEQAFLKSIDGNDTSAISTTTIDSPTDDDVFNEFTDE